eukprot:g6243.t1
MRIIFTWLIVSLLAAFGTECRSLGLCVVPHCENCALDASLCVKCSNGYVLDKYTGANCAPFINRRSLFAFGNSAHHRSGASSSSHRRSSSSNNDFSDRTLAIIGIVLGSIAGIIILAAICYALAHYCHKKQIGRPRNKSSSTSTSSENGVFSHRIG